MAEENETRVEILLDICKDLTEEHIIKACELYKDELTKNYKNEVNYIAYKNNLYRMKPTIRYANDEILKNTNKLNVPKYKSGGEYNIVADDFKRFFDIKFENAKQIQLIKFGEQEKDTTQIDFENLLLWFNEYAGRKHSKDNTEETKLGRQIREEFIKYAKRILENQSDFVMESCSQWQNSGNIKHYLWVQFKHKEYKNQPYSISLGMSKNAENEPKIYIKTEIVNNTATEEIYKNFARTLNVNVPEGFKIYDENYNLIDNQEVAKQKISNSEIQKVMIEKEISTPYLNERTDKIIKESVDTFEQIKPNYMAIFKDKEDSKMDKTAKNLILYGPPGTGKTYNTIVEAIKILDNELYEKYIKSQKPCKDLYISWYKENRSISEYTLDGYFKDYDLYSQEGHDLFSVTTQEELDNYRKEIENTERYKNQKTHHWINALTNSYLDFLKDYNSNKHNYYGDIKNRFEELKKLGRIEFVTFHQSYSYEEFIEGIKPDLTHSDLKYVLKPGVFRSICQNAEDILHNKAIGNFNFENISLYKIWLSGDNVYDYCIQNNCVAMGWANDIDFHDCKTEESIQNLFPTDYEQRTMALWQIKFFKYLIDKDINENKNVIVIVPGSKNTVRAIGHITGEYEYKPGEGSDLAHQRKVTWLKKDLDLPTFYNANFVPPTITGMYKEKVEKDTMMSLINNKEPSKKCVLIIDEINRGNISKIFGELITLIEEDKRGKLKVKLPYSQDEFTVPENLYIIGTMNTSDRSIASVDIALRRRFKFKEMMPKPGLVADFECDFRTKFEILNNKISILLDRDHQIGHSYFINTKYNDDNNNNNPETLKNIWFSEILPLLNEYFYGDWEKLQEILGKVGEKDGKSFIKKLDDSYISNNSSCYDKTTDCFDFVREDEIDEIAFKETLDKAFSKKEQK